MAPVGLNLIYLPFADDLRTPHQDQGFVGTSFPKASPDMIAAAEDLVDKLMLPYTVGAIQNPHLQRMLTVSLPGGLSEMPACARCRKCARCTKCGGCSDKKAAAAEDLVDKLMLLYTVGAIQNPHLQRMLTVSLSAADPQWSGISSTDRVPAAA